MRYIYIVYIIYILYNIYIYMYIYNMGQVYIEMRKVFRH